MMKTGIGDDIPQKGQNPQVLLRELLYISAVIND